MAAGFVHARAEIDAALGEGQAERHVMKRAEVSGTARDSKRPFDSVDDVPFGAVTRHHP